MYIPFANIQISCTKEYVVKLFIYILKLLREMFCDLASTYRNPIDFYLSHHSKELEIGCPCKLEDNRDIAHIRDFQIFQCPTLKCQVNTTHMYKLRTTYDDIQGVLVSGFGLPVKRNSGNRVLKYIIATQELSQLIKAKSLVETVGTKTCC